MKKSELKKIIKEEITRSLGEGNNTDILFENFIEVLGELLYNFNAKGLSSDDIIDALNMSIDHWESLGS